MELQSNIKKQMQKKEQKQDDLPKHKSQQRLNRGLVALDTGLKALQGKHPRHEADRLIKDLEALLVSSRKLANSATVMESFLDDSMGALNASESKDDGSLALKVTNAKELVGNIAGALKELNQALAQAKIDRDIISPDKAAKSQGKKTIVEMDAALERIKLILKDAKEIFEKQQTASAELVKLRGEVFKASNSKITGEYKNKAYSLFAVLEKVFADTATSIADQKDLSELLAALMNTPAVTTLKDGILALQKFPQNSEEDLSNIKKEYLRLEQEQIKLIHPTNVLVHRAIIARELQEMEQNIRDAAASIHDRPNCVARLDGVLEGRKYKELLDYKVKIAVATTSNEGPGESGRYVKDFRACRIAVQTQLNALVVSAKQERKREADAKAAAEAKAAKAELASAQSELAALKAGSAANAKPGSEKKAGKDAEPSNKKPSSSKESDGKRAVEKDAAAKGSKTVAQKDKKPAKPGANDNAAESKSAEAELFAKLADMPEHQDLKDQDEAGKQKAKPESAKDYFAQVEGDISDDEWFKIAVMESEASAEHEPGLDDAEGSGNEKGSDNEAEGDDLENEGDDLGNEPVMVEAKQDQESEADKAAKQAEAESEALAAELEKAEAQARKHNEFTVALREKLKAAQLAASKAADKSDNKEAAAKASSKQQPSKANAANASNADSSKANASNASNAGRSMTHLADKHMSRGASLKRAATASKISASQEGQPNETTAAPAKSTAATSSRRPGAGKAANKTMA